MLEFTSAGRTSESRTRPPRGTRDPGLLTRPEGEKGPPADSGTLWGPKGGPLSAPNGGRYLIALAPRRIISAVRPRRSG